MISDYVAMGTALISLFVIIWMQHRNEKMALYMLRVSFYRSLYEARFSASLIIQTAIAEHWVLEFRKTVVQVSDAEMAAQTFARNCLATAEENYAALLQKIEPSVERLEQAASWGEGFSQQLGVLPNEDVVLPFTDFDLQNRIRSLVGIEGAFVRFGELVKEKTEEDAHEFATRMDAEYRILDSEFVAVMEIIRRKHLNLKTPGGEIRSWLRWGWDSGWGLLIVPTGVALLSLAEYNN